MFGDLGFDDLINDIVGDIDKPRTDDITQYVAFVLDRSGSMLDIKEKAISAFNEQLQTLRKESGADIKTLVTTTMFNDFVEPGDVVPLASVDELNENTYRPAGLTALFDAIGETTLKVAKRYRDDDSDAAVLFVIITDGLENASMTFNQDKIKSMVKELEATDRWSFTFLAANQNPLETAVGELGLQMGNVMSFVPDNAGVDVASVNMAKGLSGTYDARRAGHTQTSTFYSQTDVKDEDEPTDSQGD
jgi:uncharacterized protein YegL